MRLITLLTDFGSQDWFVGTMKGVILGINPRVDVVDITHEIKPGDIRGGAFALSAAYRFFPKGTIHVAVVDPGVGSERKTIVVETSNYLFVGPDNGVLSFALNNEKIKSVHRLENARFFLKDVSNTFHGRDVFAPVAAHLSKGIPIRKLGPRQEDFLRLRRPQPEFLPNEEILGEIIYIDRFGNAITNLENKSLNPASKYAIFSGRRRLCLVRAFYASVRPGEAVAVPGSSGFLEIALNSSSASKKLKLAPGTTISVRKQHLPRFKAARS